MSAPLLHEGKDLYKQKKYEEAISRFEQIIATEPENKDALLYIGLCYLKLEDVDHFATMISSIEKALQIDPNFKEAHVAKGNSRSQIEENSFTKSFATWIGTCRRTRRNYGFIEEGKRSV